MSQAALLNPAVGADPAPPRPPAPGRGVKYGWGERLWAGALGVAASVGIGVAVLMLVFVAAAAWPALREIGPVRLLTDDGWAPTSGRFSLMPMLAGSLAAAAGAAVLTLPLGVGVALFRVFFAPVWLARGLGMVLSLLAGVPSVVYGLWGLTVLVPLLAGISPLSQGQSLLAGILILSAMTLPTVAVAADGALRAVPRRQAHGAAALGLGRTTTVLRVVLPAAAPGLAAGATLQVARAIGETLAVLMVCGNIVRVPGGLFDPVRTLTANIALEMGYAGSLHRSALFAGGLVLLAAVAALLVLERGLRGRLVTRRSLAPVVGEGLTNVAVESLPGNDVQTRLPLAADVPARASASACCLDEGCCTPWAGAASLRRARRARLRPATLLLGGWTAAGALAVAALATALFGSVLSGGLPVLVSLDLPRYLTAAPTDAGRTGGIGPVILNTVAMIGIAAAVAVPLSLGTAGALTELLGGRVAAVLRRCLDLLAATPSIVFGLFGDALFNRWLGWGPSLLAGGLTLACMILPITVRLTEAGLTALPAALRASAAALGIRGSRTFVRVLVPAALPAVAAGLTLGLGRALAETAALLFTAGYATRMPGSLLDPGRSLSVHVFDLAMNVPGGESAAGAAAAVLVGLIAGINAVALLLTRLLSRRPLLRPGHAGEGGAA